jgi:hypothetical protein
MPSWIDSIKSRLGLRGRRPDSADIYDGLRSMALGLDPASISVPDGEQWSGAAVAAMELGLAGGTAMIVAIADGTVSMYVSSGGGVIGAGEHAAVRNAADHFRRVVAESRDLRQVSGDLPRPVAGQVWFHARKLDGAFSAGAPEALLRTARHPLAPLYAAGQDLLTEIRLASSD